MSLPFHPFPFAIYFCAICEHLLIYFLSITVELLDDRWKEQRAKAEARNATTNLSTADVANNLKRLASQRSDVFDGVTGQPISEEEQARRKKAALSYDGAPETKDAAKLQQMQNVNVEEQVRRIREKYGQ